MYDYWLSQPDCQLDFAPTAHDFHQVRTRPEKSPAGTLGGSGESWRLAKRTSVVDEIVDHTADRYILLVGT